MNKTQLIECVALEANVTKKVASETVDAVLSVVSKALTEGDSVKVTGFGNFLVKERREKRGINPRTGERIIHPATTYVSFKPSKSLAKDVK
jgi:DNA-binding protein HU-beta